MVSREEVKQGAKARHEQELKEDLARASSEVERYLRNNYEGVGRAKISLSRNYHWDILRQIAELLNADGWNAEPAAFLGRNDGLEVW